MFHLRSRLRLLQPCRQLSIEATVEGQCEGMQSNRAWSPETAVESGIAKSIPDSTTVNGYGEWMQSNLAKSLETALVDLGKGLISDTGRSSEAALVSCGAVGGENDFSLNCWAVNLVTVLLYNEN